VHCLALISVVDPLLVDLVALALHGEDALVLTASLHAGPDAGPGTDLSAAPGSVTAADAPGDPGLADGFIRLTAALVPLDAGTAPVLDIARTTDCWTCSLREVLLAVVEDRARLDPDGATVVLLPPGVELIHLAPCLADDLARLPGVTLAGLAHVIDVDAAARDLLTHRPAPESVAVVEDQCAGELHMVALGYADAVVALGRDPVGRDLVEHLRPHDTLLLPGLDASGTRMFGIFLAAILLWVTEAVPLPATALVPLVLFPSHRLPQGRPRRHHRLRSVDAHGGASGRRPGPIPPAGSGPPRSASA